MIDLLQGLPLNWLSLDGLRLVVMLGLELLDGLGDVVERALGLGWSAFAFVERLFVVCLVEQLKSKMHTIKMLSMYFMNYV